MSDALSARLRAVSDAVFQRLLARFPATRPYALADLDGDGREEGDRIPAPVAHFLRQSLRRRAELEAEALRDARTPWFDYDAPGVAEAERAYLDAVAAHARVPAEEWGRALDATVGQVVPYLVRPVATLAAFVYADGPQDLTTPVVLRRMGYFGPYGYLREVVGEYVRSRGVERLDRDGFTALLERIERKTPAAYEPDAWAGLLAGLFETVGEGPGLAVPPDLLARFFADKGLTDVADRLARAPGPVTREALGAFVQAPEAPPAAPPAAPAPGSGPPGGPAGPRPSLADRWAQASAPPAAAPSAPPPPSPSPSAPATAPSPPAAASPSPPARADEPEPGERVPLWQRLLRRDADADAPEPARSEPMRSEPSRPEPARSEAPRSDAPPAPAPAPRPAAPEPRPGLADRLAAPAPREDEGEPAPLAAPYPVELGTDDGLERRVLGARASEHDRFVRHLFGGDEAAYRAALARLDAAGSWGEASAVLADAFRRHGVNLYHEVAVAFTDAAEARFAR